MATSVHTQNSLLTEHFRYTPLTLLDDIINTVNELVFRAISAIEQGLNVISPEDLGFKVPTRKALASPQAQQEALHELKQNELDAGVIQLETLLNATVDKDFDKFEIYTLRNILAVGHAEDGDLANWVRLEHYKTLDLDMSKDVSTPEQVQLQRLKLQETRKLNLMLKQEEARNAVVLEQLRALTGGGLSRPATAEETTAPFAFLTSSSHTSQSATAKPLTQNVQHALTQLPVLRQLLAQLKGSLQSMPNARHAQDEESAAAKRRRYLDTQSQRAAERRGFQTDAASRASHGRRIGREEVAALETVVQAIGGGVDDGRTAGDEMEE